MRYLMTFAYDGSNYSGYQKQTNVRTIQDEIESKLKKINNNYDVNIHSSGRTDALVHAINQKAHFDLSINITTDNLKRALNSLVSSDIYIKNIVEVNEEFHARFDVVAKEYIYKINVGNYDPFLRKYNFQYNKLLDVEKMKLGIKLFEGTHNFKSFTKTNNIINDYVRTIIDTEIKLDNKIITIYFKGTGFLRYMVRNMVGLLIEIGENKRNIGELVNILESENRSLAGKTAPPEGLYLKDVYY
ncbi:MAG: tRNA pseudouridine(38-40) synthase TruA [Bacilli bacterium]